MGIQALNLSDTARYVSKHDKGEPQTTWILGIIDTRIRKQIEDIAWEYEATPGRPADAKAKCTFNISKSELEYVAFGLKGFENFRHADGKQVYFKTEDRVAGNKVYQVIADDILRIIPGDIITELATEIKRINNLSEEEKKT